jgi:hypothetical protein
MKTRRAWSKPDKEFLRRLSRAVERAAEVCDGPMMDYYPNVKVGRKLGSWSRRLRAVAKSIDRDIDRIPS